MVETPHNHFQQIQRIVGEKEPEKIGEPFLMTNVTQVGRAWKILRSVTKVSRYFNALERRYLLVSWIVFKRRLDPRNKVAVKILVNISTVLLLRKPFDLFKNRSRLVVAFRKWRILLVRVRKWVSDVRRASYLLQVITDCQSN